MQNAKNFGSSLKRHFILKYLHNPFEAGGVMYVLKIQHMLKLLLLNIRLPEARFETICMDLLPVSLWQTHNGFN